MQHIETVTVGSGGSSSITFMAIGDIPSEYTDLKIVLSLRGNASSTYNDTFVQFNGDTGSNYSMRRLYGTGSGSGASDSLSGGANYGRVGSSSGNTSTANTFANLEIYIPNYRSNVAKSFMSDGATENNATGAFMTLYADLYSGTSPITSITIFGLSTTFVEHSTATLYGITAGSDGITAVS